jgi:hypothetical protein
VTAILALVGGPVPVVAIYTCRRGRPAERVEVRRRARSMPRPTSEEGTEENECGVVSRRARCALARQTVCVTLRRAVLVVVALGALYLRFLRTSVLTWGATDTEAAQRLPGDELLEEADGVATRAIEIEAPPAAVWPWIAQMGPSPRGGAYTYDWIENLLGLNMHSVDRVLPEFQHPQLGDTIGYGSNRMRLERVEPEHVLAWRSEDGNWVWTFVLEARNGSTRLISRNRFRLPTLTARLGMIPMEPASLVMERKMLRGIKNRAERQT